MSDILRDLARAKVAFQLRAIEAIIRDSDAAAVAAPCGDMAVPQDQQARASNEASPKASEES